MSEPQDQHRLPPRTDIGFPHVIVCETSSRWAVAMGRELSAHGDIQIEQSRSMAECCERLDDAPGSFVVVELTRGNIDMWLARMAELEWKYPLARVAVVVRDDPLDNKSLNHYRWLIREAGAVFFGTSLRGEGPQGEKLGGVRELTEIVRRHLRRTPRPQKSVSEEIWDNLPWKPSRSS